MSISSAIKSINHVIPNDCIQYQVETIQIDDETSFTLACSSECKQLPANGGIRWRPYASRKHQEDEAIMLAQRMSLKHGLYNTGFSGGKIVVNSKRSPKEQPEVLEAIADLLNHYNGSMFTGCDINTDNQDMSYLRHFTPWILNAMDSPLIDTSTATGFGVWSSIHKILLLRLADQTHPRIVIHGMGKVGCEVAKQSLLFGCEVWGYDINPQANFPRGVKRLTETQFWQQSSDIVCIASLSGTLTLENVDLLDTQWVVSSANSPFSNTAAQLRLLARGVLYLPDYVSNAGAVICDSIEMTFAHRYNLMTQEEINAYVHSVIGGKTAELLRCSQLLECDISMLLQPPKLTKTAA
ncbi:Glu/Leu/Phe/Val dehydrogenase dimerization domain-containing protein [Rouxiella sp. Mn2063]|uniref:Glu/Leu/Phe/Val dehydrogenase dimerization domain-containing protein n=1 Tax=Rouxiella sp. Mn2063 TaxID=3395262 RepID=UPI003BD2474A